MNLEFLSAGEPGSAGADPVARSPMEAPARAAGAHFAVRDGFNVAVRYGPEMAAEARAGAQTVGWADESHLAKLELQGTGQALDAAAGSALEPGSAVRHDAAWWCRLTRSRLLIVGAGRAVRERVGTADGIDVADVTSNFAALTMVGPLAREVLARFCALDLRPAVTPVGALRPGSIARQPAILICEAADRYLFMFGWATGEYMWSVVADAGRHLGGRPIGADALAALPVAAGTGAIGA